MITLEKLFSHSRNKILSIEESEKTKHSLAEQEFIDKISCYRGWTIKESIVGANINCKIPDISITLYDWTHSITSIQIVSLDFLLRNLEKFHGQTIWKQGSFDDMKKELQKFRKNESWR